MSMRPLVGMIRLPIVKLVAGKPHGSWWEIAGHVAFDVEGRPWLLVMRYERIEGNLLRIGFSRWHALEQLPVEEGSPLKLALERRISDREYSDPEDSPS